jgi:metal-responsive CopG/Arc/MetJ family transcriptional regulator
MDMTSNPERMERLQVAISLDELKAIDDFRCRHRMPSRTAVVREILRRMLGNLRKPIAQ